MTIELSLISVAAHGWPAEQGHYMFYNSKSRLWNRYFWFEFTELEIADKNITHWLGPEPLKSPEEYEKGEDANHNLCVTILKEFT